MEESIPGRDHNVHWLCTPAHWFPCGDNRPGGEELKPMTCLRCQNELPEDHEGNRCPICGASKIRFRWLVFLCALLLPPLLTLVSAAWMRTLPNPVNENFSPNIAFIGGGIGGIVCGLLLAFRAAKNIPLRVALSIVLSGLMIVVCVALCLCGCTVGGYQFRIGE